MPVDYSMACLAAPFSVRCLRSAPFARTFPLLPSPSRHLHSPLYLLSPSALSDFPPSPPSTLHNAVVIGLAPNSLAYHGEPGLNTAFRLLAGEEGLGKGKVSLIVTHRATVVGDKDGKLSLGPGEFARGMRDRETGGGGSLTSWGMCRTFHHCVGGGKWRQGRSR